MKAPLLILITCCCVLISCGEKPTSTEKAEPQQLDRLALLGNKEIAKNKHIVLVSGDEEYRSEEVLPELGRILSDQHGFDCTVLFAQDPEKLGTINPNYRNNIPGLEELEKADLMILFTRFRNLPDEQMNYFQDYLMAGKPVLGIRTATHAFYIKDSTNKWFHWGNYFNEEGSPWNEGFGRVVLGENWHTHHGHHKHQSTRGIIAEGAETHPIARGLKLVDIWGPTDVYGVRLENDESVTPIILGTVLEREGEFDENDPFFGLKPTDAVPASVNPAEKTPYNPNDPMMPIAWTKTYQLPGGQSGTSFTSTIGSSTDFMSEGVRRLLVNATYFLMDMEVPQEAQIGISSDYSPSAYSFQDDEYWVNKNLQVSDYWKPEEASAE
ncbi:MAG: ThuA domain-containing protein [Bacteroidota bacterium]